MISCPLPACSRKCWILAGAALTYFVAFPEDCDALLAPLRLVLSLSFSISPWLYGLAAVALVCWTACACWRTKEPTDGSPATFPVTHNPAPPRQVGT